MAEAAARTLPLIFVLIALMLVVHGQPVPSPVEAPAPSPQGDGVGSSSSGSGSGSSGSGSSSSSGSSGPGSSSGSNTKPGSGSGSPQPDPGPDPPGPRPPGPPRCCFPFIFGYKTFQIAFYWHVVKEPVPGHMVCFAPLLGEPLQNQLPYTFGSSQVFDCKLTFDQDYGSSECGRLQGFSVTNSFNGLNSDMHFHFFQADSRFNGYVKVTGCHNFSSTINKYIIEGGTGWFKGAEGTFDTYEVTRYGPNMLNHVDYCLIKVKIEPKVY